MACDATARLYDVDEDSVVFKKLKKTNRYDQGTVTFSARKGKLISLDQLHESIWATRLSGGTRSGLVNLEVTVIGQVIETNGAVELNVSGSDAKFRLIRSTDEVQSLQFDQLKSKADEETFIRITGQVENYKGRWPYLLRGHPKNPRGIIVSTFEVIEKP